MKANNSLLALVVAPIITGLVSSGVALIVWTYYQSQTAALTQYKVDQIERNDAEQDQRLDEQGRAILKLLAELEDVNRLKVQVGDNRAVIEVYGRLIERNQEGE